MIQASQMLVTTILTLPIFPSIFLYLVAVLTYCLIALVLFIIKTNNDSVYAIGSSSIRKEFNWHTILKWQIIKNFNKKDNIFSILTSPISMVVSANMLCSALCSRLLLEVHIFPIVTG